MNSEQPMGPLPDRGYEDGLGELPPNVPPGILGEIGPDIRKVDGDGPHGLNAGLIQESTAETALITVFLLLIVFFPAAYVVLWRSRKIGRRSKIVISALMTGLIAYVFVRIGLPRLA